jgi:branched-chain amino acid aminotransferase
LEGLSSNFFAVHQGTLWTAGEGVLAGVTRSLVLDCIRRLQLPLRLEALHRDALPELQEAFLTSSSRGILPVRSIDTNEIGKECPGPLTRQLMQAFELIIDEKAEPI